MVVESEGKVLFNEVISCLDYVASVTDKCTWKVDQ